MYLLDTGLKTTHPHFSRRASCEYDVYESNCTDKNGHGTHVAGIVGGSFAGVAKEVNLISVKVLSDAGIGSFSDMLRGLDYVIGQRILDRMKPMIINLSSGGGLSVAMNEAVNKAVVDFGIVVVTAAGNDSTDACTKSPSSASSAITVGSVNKFDFVSKFSNIGSCVDIYSFGENVISSGATTVDLAVMSGTSQSSAIVAGVAALHMERNPLYKPVDVLNAILANKYIQIHPSFTYIASTLNFRFEAEAIRPAPVPRPTPCKDFLSSCRQNADCCSGRCKRNGRCGI